MSAEATGWVWKHSPYSGAQLLVHLAIADVVNDVNDNEFWMSTSALASKSKVARSTVIATLSDLQARGLMQMLESGAASRRPSRFRFLMPTRPLTGLGPEEGLDRPSVQLDRSSVVTRPLSNGSLDRSPVANPKEITQEPKGAALVSKSAPNCIRCRGEGQIWSGGAGSFVACSCTVDRPLVSIPPEYRGAR